MEVVVVVTTTQQMEHTFQKLVALVVEQERHLMEKELQVHLV
jgi:hypothetical protein